eukprot:s772_g3.t1
MGPLVNCANAQACLLEWRPTAVGCRPKHVKKSRGSLFSRLWINALVFLGTPCQVWAAPKGLHVLAEIVDANSSVIAASSGSDVFPAELEDSPASLLSQHGPAGIGIEVLAPHYHTAYASAQLDTDEGIDELTAIAAATAARAFHPDLCVVEPCKPQLFVGYASFVAQPACLSSTGQAVAILDLLRVGGNRFACVLPAQNTLRALGDFARSLASQDHDAFDFFVGVSGLRHDGEGDIFLTTGDVIQVLPAGAIPTARPHIDSLLEARASWCAADQFPRPCLKPGICLLFGQHRYFISRRSYPGQPPGEVAAQAVGLLPGASMLRIAQPPGLTDLTIHGNICKGAACILAIDPPPLADDDSRARPDNVWFFDLRPTGARPVHHYQLGDTRHVRTVLDSIGVHPPPGHVFSFDRGSDRGFVTAPSGTTIVCRAVPIENEAAVEDSDGPDDDGDGRDNDTRPSDDEGGGADAEEGESSGGSGPHRPRSRSPRRHGTAGCQAVAGQFSKQRWPSDFPFPPKQVEPLHRCDFAAGFADMWCRCVFIGCAFAEGHTSTTPVDDGPLSRCLPRRMVSEVPCKLCGQVGPALDIDLHVIILLLQIVEAWALAYCGAAFVVSWAGVIACKGPSAASSQGRREETCAANPLGTDEGPLDYDGPAQRPPPRLQTPAPITVPQIPGDRGCHWHFVLIGPEICQEHVEVVLPVPCTIPGAIAAIAEVRDEVQHAVYGALTPVVPQPSDDFGVFVCMPWWAGHKIAVCIDTRACDGRIFCVVLSGRYNRESLIAIAGLADEPGVAVYLGSSWVALRSGQLATLSHGLLVTILPVIQIFRPGESLQAMLLRRRNTRDAALLPRTAFGRLYWVLTDAWSFAFDASGCTRDSFRVELAASLRADFTQVSVQCSMPVLSDYDYRGRHCPRVIVATEQISRVPVPPGRPQQNQCICLLDQRPILNGVRWILAPNSRVDLQRLADSISVHVPDGYRVSVVGGPIVHENGRVLVPVWPGQVLTVQFLPNPPASDTGASPSRDSEASDNTDGDAGSAGSDDDNDSPPGGLSTADASPVPDSARSRSPPRSGSGHESDDAALSVRRHLHGGRTSFCGMQKPLALCWVFVILFGCLPSARAVHLAAYRGHHPPVADIPIVFDRSDPTTGGARCEADPPDVHVCRPKPLPTPCRAPGRLHAFDPIDDIGPTLLEESRAASNDWALWCTATLLEALLEHFETIQEGAAPSPTTISLARCLPYREINVSNVAVKVGRTIDDVMPFFNTAWPLERDIISSLDLHAATRAALGQLRLFESHVGDCSAVEIFTDGSFDGVSSTWAFIAIAKGADGDFLLGTAYGRVALDGDDGFIGAPFRSALNGERTALFWALAWSLQLPEGTRCHVWSDCLVAKGQTDGTYCASENTTLGQACRAIALTAESAGRLDWESIQHVRAHVGHPFNELADTVAKAAFVRQSAIPASFASLTDWVRTGDVHWIWLLVETIRRPADWPALQADTLVDTGADDTPDVGRLSCSAFGFVGDASSQAAAAHTAVCFCPTIVSANVQTLQENQENGISGRVPYIREQLEAMQASIIGLQETRSARAETVSSTTHFRYASPRDAQGNHGVELWLAKTVPFGWQNRHPLYFAAEDIRILHWCPRTLFANFVRGRIGFVIVVLHAPTAADPNREAWWRDFKMRLSRSAKRAPVVLIGDFNARLTRELPGRIGDLCWESGTGAPDPLLSILEEHDLWVPSTYSACHHGESATWLAPGSGAASRIDFIIIPTGWRCAPGNSTVLAEVDFGQKGVDHFGVSLTVDAWYYGHARLEKRPPRIDVSQLVAPEATAIVADICRRMPTIGWGVDAHTHYDRFAGFLASELSRADERWLSHFAAIEDGASVDPAAHVAGCISKQEARDLDAVTISTADVPHRVALENSMRSTQCGRASGNDQIPTDLVHLRTPSLSKQVFQIFLKVACRLSEPLHWKGGTLRAVWKQKGDQLDPSSYRAILVSSAIGKSIHGLFRTKCSDFLENATTPLQVGGRRGQPVLIAAQAVRAFQASAIAAGQSCAVLFVDLREAFHRVVRPLIHGGELDDAHIAGIVRELSLEPAVIPRLHQYVRQHSLLIDAGATEWTAVMLQEFYESSWFTFGGSHRIASVRGGTRPGDNLADMYIYFLVCRSL